MASVTMGMMGLGCASAGNIPVVQSEYWKNENFAAYARYGWLPSDAHLRGRTQTEDHRLHDLIREAIDDRLAVRGFGRVRAEGADFLVTYHCKIDEELQADVIDRVWYGGAGDEGDWEEVTRRIELSAFEQGSIVIDFVNPVSGKRVWRGVARGRVSPDASPEQLREIVDRSVREILDEFPPAT
jgi:hypothetical protein